VDRGAAAAGRPLACPPAHGHSSPSPGQSRGPANHGGRLPCQVSASIHHLSHEQASANRPAESCHGPEHGSEALGESGPGEGRCCDSGPVVEDLFPQGSSRVDGVAGVAPAAAARGDFRSAEHRPTGPPVSGNRARLPVF
jgi:hypothetical protein